MATGLLACVAPVPKVALEKNVRGGDKHNRVLRRDDGIRSIAFVRLRPTHWVAGGFNCATELTGFRFLRQGEILRGASTGCSLHLAHGFGLRRQTPSLEVWQLPGRSRCQPCRHAAHGNVATVDSVCLAKLGTPYRL